MSNTPADPRLARALELIAEAEKLTAPGDPASLGRAVANAEGAIQILVPLAAATRAPDLTNTLASAWMKRGIALLVFSSAQSLPESIRCFDEAIRLRRGFRATEHPWPVFGLAAGWMNRGDALARLGGEANVHEAVRSYDEALTILRTLPFDQVPQFRGRLVVALTNRAVVIESLRSTDAIAESIAANREVIALIRGTPFEQHPDFRLQLGAACTNLANMVLNPAGPRPDADEARSSAEAAIEAVAGLDRENPMAGDIAIKAHRTVFRSIAAQLESRQTSAPTSREFLNAMTDAIDEALGLARFWEARGVARFRPLAVELFGLGANLYLRHQPHFFAEYVLDNLDPARAEDAFRSCPEMQELAEAMITDALQHYERDRIITVDTRGVERQIETLRDLRHARERLTALRPSQPASAPEPQA